MQKTSTIFALVKRILEDVEDSRSSDHLLYYLVLQEYAERTGIKLQSLEVRGLFSLLEYHLFPPFETVRRSRQKIQRKNPALAVSNRPSPPGTNWTAYLSYHN